MKNDNEMLRVCKTLFKGFTNGMFPMFVGAPVLATPQERTTQRMAGCANGCFAACKLNCIATCKGSCQMSCTRSCKGHVR